MTPKQKLYLQLLELGLNNIKLATERGDAALAECEIIHLHNIPRYIQNERLVDDTYYYEKERTAYLAKIEAIPGAKETVALMGYQSIWPLLDKQILRK